MSPCAWLGAEPSPRSRAEASSPGGVLLDGSHDWLSEADDLFGGIDGPEDPFGVALPVRMQVKADLSCAVVAAASVLAKVARDRLMAETEDPGYGWASNKGYGSAAHARAIAELGVSDFHRRHGRCRRSPQSRARRGGRVTRVAFPGMMGSVSEEIEGYENNLELELFKEYRDVIGLFKFVVETERRFYLCNHVDVQARPVGGDVFLS